MPENGGGGGGEATLNDLGQKSDSVECKSLKQTIMYEEQKKEKILDSWWILLLQQNTTEAFWSLEWNFMVKQTNSNIRTEISKGGGTILCLDHYD